MVTGKWQNGGEALQVNRYASVDQCSTGNQVGREIPGNVGGESYYRIAGPVNFLKSDQEWQRNGRALLESHGTGWSSLPRHLLGPHQGPF